MNSGLNYDITIGKSKKVQGDSFFFLNDDLEFTI